MFLYVAMGADYIKFPAAAKDAVTDRAERAEPSLMSYRRRISLAEWQKRLGTKSRPYQFYEGNLIAVMPRVQDRLEELELLTYVMGHASQRSDSETWYDDTTAIKVILPYVSQDILRRWRPAYPITASNLMALLITACQPFRFIDLPRDIRNLVYEHLVGYNGDIVEPAGWVAIDHSPFYKMSKVTRPYYVDEVDGTGRRVKRPSKMRNLSAVSTQIRNEALKIYYSRNRFRAIFNPIRI